MKKQSGFTLVELIIVIVIISILVAFALARFVDLQQEARIATVEQVAGVMKSQSAIIHSVALTNGITDGSVTIDGNEVSVKGSYIEGHWNIAWFYALDVGKVISFTAVASECTGNDLCGVGNQNGNNSVYSALPISTGGVTGLVTIWLKGDKISDNCYAYFFNAEDGSDPVIGSVTSGC